MKASIIDVRTPGEFASGHVKGSLNIPMQEVRERIDEIRAMAEPRIFVCASGNRSGQVVRFLSQVGISCENGGSWMEVNRLSHV